MNFANQVKPWWEISGRNATLKTADGLTAETPCHISRPPYPDRPHIQRFRFPMSGHYSVSELGFALLKSGKVTELCVDGAWYRVRLKTGIIGVNATTTRPMTIDECVQYAHGLELDAEAIPGPATATGITTSDGKRSIKEQVLGVLKSAPNGLTPKEISDRTECSARWVFSTLAALVRAGSVEKRGGTYFIQNSTPVCE